jgi:hypothetical protein
VVLAGLDSEAAVMISSMVEGRTASAGCSREEG